MTTTDDFVEAKTRYAHTLVDLLREPGCERMKARWEILNALDKQFSLAGLRMVIRISLEEKPQK